MRGAGVVDRGIELLSIQSGNYTISICCFSAKHAYFLDQCWFFLSFLFCSHFSVFCNMLLFSFFFLFFCVCLRPVFYVPNVASVSGLSIRDCPFDCLYCLFSHTIFYWFNSTYWYKFVNVFPTLIHKIREQKYTWIITVCHWTGECKLMSLLTIAFIIINVFCKKSWMISDGSEFKNLRMTDTAMSNR